MLVHCYNIIFNNRRKREAGRCASKGENIFKSVSFNSGYHRYTWSFTFLACQPTAIKYSFVFTCILLKRCVFRERNWTMIRLPTKLWTDKFKFFFQFSVWDLFLEHFLFCQVSTSILKWNKSSLRKAAHYSLNTRFYPDRW